MARAKGSRTVRLAPETIEMAKAYGAEHGHENLAAREAIELCVGRCGPSGLEHDRSTMNSLCAATAIHTATRLARHLTGRDCHVRVHQGKSWLFFDDEPEMGHEIGSAGADLPALDELMGGLSDQPEGVEVRRFDDDGNPIFSGPYIDA